MKVFYVNENKPCYFDGEKKVHFESKQIDNYKENCNQIARSQDWKNSGQSAMFQGRGGGDGSTGMMAVTGVSGYTDSEFLYSTITGNTSSIIKKDLEDGSETLLMHENGNAFKGISYFPDSDKILSSMWNFAQTQSVCIYRVADNLLSAATDGDTLDIEPFLCADGTIIYTSVANGRDVNNELIGKDCAVIYSLKGNSCEEIKRVENVDLLLPKKDNFGNLYYIKKPYKQKIKKSMGVLDIILLPFRLIYGLFRVLFFLSKISVKKKGKNDDTVTSGDNPARSSQIENSMDLYGYTIDLEEKQQTKKSKRKNANEDSQSGQDEGFAPSSWELYRCDSDGVEIKLASKVLAFDLNPNDKTVIYTNGKGVYRLAENQKPELLFKDKIITAISIKRDKNKITDLFNF